MVKQRGRWLAFSIKEHIVVGLANENFLSFYGGDSLERLGILASKCIVDTVKKERKRG